MTAEVSMKIHLMNQCLEATIGISRPLANPETLRNLCFYAFWGNLGFYAFRWIIMGTSAVI